MLQERMTERVTMFVAWHLPRRVVMWCAIRVMAEATAGKFHDVPAPDVRGMDAIVAWSPTGAQQEDVDNG